MKDKIKLIMASVFELSPDQIGDDASPDTILVWDSLRHMNLVTVLEEEFDIRLTDEQITEMLNLDLVVFTVNEVLAAK
ncbi:acyl carrier protein [Sediminibacterium roseum]|uniref:Acyl carrier protein n=1 Tax=Sediminibacterium roseum TaxID=1978412 RepID=A0ABW9ZTJ6_9BACT|nr:acyl carrier protein [Sediminibacterium roseum]NCI49077.1 acyl carrier protein [Sediminibacterium roseum]